MLRLSLVIATYNRAESLLVTLNSVAAQTTPVEQWECIVVNNNSTDDTEQRFKEFAQAHPNLRLRMVNELRQGLSFARNRGIGEGEGEYIAIIDDDERIAPDFISSYIELFDSTPDAMAAGGPIVAEYPTGKPRWMSRFTERPIANTMYFGDKICIFPSGRIPGGGNMALRRSAVKRYGVFDTALGYVGEQLIGGEECDLFERLQIAEAKYYYVPGAVMYHIIPKEKLSLEYLSRLSYNVGVSQVRRARYYHRIGRVKIKECIKWCATLLLAAWYGITLQWSKAKYLLVMRCNITRGIWSKSI